MKKHYQLYNIFLNIYNLNFKYIGGSGQDRWVVIVMTQTQPNSQLKKFHNPT